MRRQRARGPNERARNAGGVLGVCGATRRGQGRGGEGKAEGAGGAEAGARVSERSGGWMGSLRAREGGCGAWARTSELAT